MSLTQKSHSQLPVWETQQKKSWFERKRLRHVRLPRARYARARTVTRAARDTDRTAYRSTVDVRACVHLIYDFSESATDARFLREYLVCIAFAIWAPTGTSTSPRTCGPYLHGRRSICQLVDLSTTLFFFVAPVNYERLGFNHFPGNSNS